MDYFAAVQEGRKRAGRAADALQDVVGQSYPMLLLKLGVSSWTPVGEEALQKILSGKNDTAALVICDSDGNAKAMSGWLSESRARECSKILEQKGVPMFRGEVKLPI